MKVVWYTPNQAADFADSPYFPVAFSRAEETVYLPAWEPMHTTEEALEQLLDDRLISVGEFEEVRSVLHQLAPGGLATQTPPFQGAVRKNLSANAAGVRPFVVEVTPACCSVLVRDLRWLRAVGDEEEKRLGVWLWVAAYLEADVLDFDPERTYLAGPDGEVLARLVERPPGYQRSDLEQRLELPVPSREPHEVRFATTLVFHPPIAGELPSATSPDVLHLALKPLRIERYTVEWEFAAASPSYPLIKAAGPCVVMVEGFGEGRLSAEGERQYLDERNGLSRAGAGEYCVQHPVLLAAVRLTRPAEGPSAEGGNWHSPLDVLRRCPLTVTIETEEGQRLTPGTATIAVPGDQPEELEATFHFCDLPPLPPLSGIQVEVLTVVDC